MILCPLPFKPSHLGQPVRQLLHFSRSLDDRALFTRFDTFSTFIAVKIINHMDIFCFSFDTILRAGIHTFAASVTYLRVNIDGLCREADPRGKIRIFYSSAFWKL